MDRSESFYRLCDLEAVDKVVRDVMSTSRVLFTLCRGLDLRHLVVSTDDKGGEAVMDLAAEVLAFGVKMRQASDALSERIKFDILGHAVGVAFDREGNKEEQPKQA